VLREGLFSCLPTLWKSQIGNMKELRERTGSDGKNLESVFFKLTGGEEVKRIVDALKV